MSRSKIAADTHTVRYSTNSVLAPPAGDAHAYLRTPHTRTRCTLRMYAGTLHTLWCRASIVSCLSACYRCIVQMHKHAQHESKGERARRPTPSDLPPAEALLDVNEIQLPPRPTHPFPVGSLEPSLAAIAAQYACSGGATARGKRT